MEDLGYIIDGNRAAELISGNIYNPVSSIVEKVADYYDADATEVKVNFLEKKDIDGKVYVNQIIIKGDGEGFLFDDLNKLREIGNSKKKKNMYTNKFKRVKLGSFGIAFTSFQNLGNQIEIYSKVKSGKILYKKIIVENKSTRFTDVKELNYCDLIKHKTGCTLIIKNCKIPKDILLGFDLLKNKLAYLPLSENFKIYLCNEEIKRNVIADENFYKETFNFIIENIKFNCKVYCSPNKIKNAYFRGVYLQIDGRIIDWNIFNDIRQGITSPGSLENKIQGYIIANELRNKINASRTGLTDTNLSLNISQVLKKHIGSIRKRAKKYYEWKQENSRKREDKMPSDNIKKVSYINKCSKKQTGFEIDNLDKKMFTIEQKEKYNKSKREEKAKKRIRNTNNDLKKLGINFCYEPESEIELIIIVAQMCQKRLLDFDIIQAFSNEYPDSIIMKDGELAFLEFEQSLQNFYIHNHNHNKVSYIICWDVDKKIIDNKKEVYLKNYSGYLKSIESEKAVSELCSDNLIFNNCDGTQHIIKLYVLSDIIKNFKI